MIQGSFREMYMRRRPLACSEGPDVRTLDPQSAMAAAKITRFNSSQYSTQRCPGTFFFYKLH